MKVGGNLSIFPIFDCLGEEDCTGLPSLDILEIAAVHELEENLSLGVVAEVCFGLSVDLSITAKILLANCTGHGAPDELWSFR